MPGSVLQPAEKASTQHLPVEPADSSEKTASSLGWNFDLMDHQLEPEVGLPISCAYIPLQEDFLSASEVSLDIEKHGLKGNGRSDHLRAPEMLEILTNEFEHLLPLEEPDNIEDMVSKDVPSFLERNGEDEEEPSPLVELEKEMVNDIPVVINKYVERYFEYFQNKARKNFEHWLARSHRYIPMMKKLMAEHGLPEDLVYMAMIESGFNPRAYSRAHAVGPWQFIASTARKYGLRVDWWVDERRDPEKSTRAAIAYLKDLYDIFGSWYLAAASYNAGEARISREVDRRQTSDFWTLSRRSRRLKQETKSYIPKLIAAIIISKNQEKYGFTNIKPEEPHAFDRVLVQRSVDLRALAKACGTTYEHLKELNPELKHWITPPGRKEYCLKVPENTGIKFYKNLAQMKPLKKVTYGGYVVQRGDTLSKVARRFGSTVRSIMEANRITNPRRLMPGQKLFIPGRPVPIRARHAGAVASRSVPKPSIASRSTSLHRTHKHEYSGEMKEHILQKGETLWDVAQHYSLNVKELMKINNIRNPRRIRAGIRLRIRYGGAVASRSVPEPSIASRSTSLHRTHKHEYSGEMKEHILQKGETLWDVAQHYSLNVKELMKINNIRNPRRIRAGIRLRIRYGGAVASRSVPEPSIASRSTSLHRTHKHEYSGEMKEHILQKGETLWSVAQYYSLNVKELMKINNIRNARRIRAGICLRIPKSDTTSGRVKKLPPMARQDKNTPGQVRNTKPKEILYTVQKGDNIWSISRRYGIKMSKIFRWNNLDAKAQIYPGDKLRLIVNAEI